jgi:hypothetical protein
MSTRTTKTKRPRLGHTLEEIIKKRQDSEQSKKVRTQTILSQFRTLAATDTDQTKDQELQKINQNTQSDTGIHQILVSENTVLHQIPVSDGYQYLEPETNYFKTPNIIGDQLLALLDTYEFKVYFRLFRLSHGFRTNQCFVGYKALAAGCGLSISHIKRVIPQLISKGLIKIIEVVNTATKKGTIYEINTSIQQRLVSSKDPSPADTSIQQSPNKRHDDHDDSLKTDHHQTRARAKNPDDDLSTLDAHQKDAIKIYQTITGNEWKKSDEAAYQKIKHIVLEKIEQGIRLASQRATNRPNSLNYFVKEILSLANPSQQSKTQQKKALEKIVQRVRELHTGEANYSFSDFAEDVKQACVHEGVFFNNNLFNDILEKQA